MNKLKSQNELLSIFTNIGDDKQWTSPLLELFSLVGMKWSEKRRKIKENKEPSSFGFNTGEIKKRLSLELLPIADENQSDAENRRNYELLSVNDEAIRLRRSPTSISKKSKIKTKPKPKIRTKSSQNTDTKPPRRSARLAQKRKSRLKSRSNKEENDEDEQDEDDQDDDLDIIDEEKEDIINIDEIFNDLTIGSLFCSITYLNVISIYDSILNCIHCIIDYSNHHKKCHYPSISNGNAQVFANKLVEVMIRSYSLNNESKILYQDGILHDMYVSSEQLINTLCHIILYRDDSNNLISLILQQLLSINAPPNCIDNISTLSSSISSMSVNDGNNGNNNDENKDILMMNNDENAPPLKTKQLNKKNPRKRTRDQMSSDDVSNDYDDNKRDAKRFKASHTSPHSTNNTMNSSINVITGNNGINRNEYWCKSLPLPICNWILRLMLESPKISKDAISKYCKRLFQGFWKFAFNTIIKQFHEEINEQIDEKEETKEEEEDKEDDVDETPVRIKEDKDKVNDITVAAQHIVMFLRLVLSSNNGLRKAFIHESMSKIHKMAVFVNESLHKIQNKNKIGIFVFHNKSLRLLFRCIVIMNQSVLSMIQKSKEKENKDKKSTNSNQIDIKYNSMDNIHGDQYRATVYPPYYKMGYNPRIFNDPLQQNQSFYSLKYPNTSYPIDQVRERLFLSPLTSQNMHKLLLSVHEIFEENGCHYSDELCLKPLDLNTLKVIRSNSKTSAQDYIDSIIYFTYLLSNDLKSNFKYNCRVLTPWAHQKRLFMDLTRLLCTLPISEKVQQQKYMKNNKIASEMKEIRNTLTWKAIDPSNPMHLIVVSRVLSLSFYYSHKEIPLNQHNQRNDTDV